MKTVKKILTVLMIVSLLAAVLSFAQISVGAESVKHTITFDVQGIGETPDPITVEDGEKYMYLWQNNPNNPTADGYVFHCWVTTLDYEPDEVSMSNNAAYLETPIHEDMTLYAVWYKLIDRVDVTVDLPVPGDVIGTALYEGEDYSYEYQTPTPHAVVTSEGAQVQENFWHEIEYNAFWLENPNDIESIFKGTFENGKTYGVQIIVEPKFGYEFSESLYVTLNGQPVKNVVNSDYCTYDFTAPVLCGEAPAATEPETTQSATVPAPDNTAAKSATNDSAVTTPNSGTVQTGESSTAVVALSALAAVAAVMYYMTRKKSA